MVPVSGIPSNPSFVPSVVGYETTKMPFHRRVFNAMVYSMLWTTRQWFDFDATHAFKHAIGRRFYKKVRSKSSGRAVLTFATPFEFIVDTSRPIARNLHYYGCDHCFEAATGPVQKASEVRRVEISSLQEEIRGLSYRCSTYRPAQPVSSSSRSVQ